MGQYGYDIINVLITDIQPERSVLDGHERDQRLPAAARGGLREGTLGVEPMFMETLRDFHWIFVDSNGSFIGVNT